jgi:putative PIN family toxin of toxin-antitoxin system
MRCFIDTNILISAGIFPNSISAFALEKALTPPNVAIICDYTLEEMHRVANRKFPQYTEALEKFLYRVLFSAVRIGAPFDIHESETQIRDVKDRPLLRAAIQARADVLITGDKDFTESTVTNPQIVTAAQFLKME